MIGVTPASAYCGAKLVEAVGLDPAFLGAEFPGVPGHLGGIGPEVAGPRVAAVPRARPSSPDTKGPARRRASSATARAGAPHFNGPDVVRALHEASGYAKKARLHAPGSPEAYAEYSAIVSEPRADHRPRPARRSRTADAPIPLGRGRARGGRALALHGAGDERGRALRARAPRGGARHERAPPLLPADASSGRAGPCPTGIGPSPTAARAGSTRRASARATATAACSTRGRASPSRP